MRVGHLVSGFGGVVAGLALGAVLVRFAGSGATTTPGASLVSDVHGSLEEVCIQYRKDFHPESFETIADLLAALPSAVTVRIVVAEQAEYDFLMGALEKNGAGIGREMTAVVTGFQITPWAKDRFGTLVTGKGRALLGIPPTRSPVGGARGNDQKVPAFLAARLKGVECRILPFVFEGGDLLSDETNVYVAANFLARNRPYDVDDRTGLTARMATALGKRVVVIGGTVGDVPDHHIGMYLTPLGDNTVAVADPDLGLKLYRSGRGEGSRPDVETNVAAYACFRNVIEIMERKGFEVVRVPLLLTGAPRVYVTYNNAILEQRDGENRVYMPVYGIPELDDAAGAVFERAGWRVLPVRVGRIYECTGSLRCLVGILRRGGRSL